MWHDNETTTDYLNFGVVADACAKLLQQANGEPISIGVSGGWGVGKSSLVRMVAARLNIDADAEKNTYVVVTFNPWLYQDFEGARSALLQMVGDEVLRRAAASEALTKKAKKLLQRINLLRVIQLGGEAAVTIATGVPVGLIGRALAKAGLFGNKPEDSDNDKADKDEGFGLLKPNEPVSLPGEIQAFRDALEVLLEELKITLIVFVDDLDRCLPQTAISTLESIRLLLFLKRSAFVVAADNEFIRGAVRVHFAGTGISDEVATNYFDKLIQVPLHVPRLGVNEAKAYLALLLLERARADGDFVDGHFTQAVKAMADRLKTSWRGDAVTLEFLMGLMQVKNANVAALMELAEGLAPLLTSSSKVNANPRLMKRFLNTVFLRKALAEPQGIELDLKALAKWHLLERCDESLANTIASRVNSAGEGRVEMLREAEQKVRAGEALPDPFRDEFFHKEWLSLEPALGETDLRPLLHLSRDSATRDFGDDSLTQEGRALRDALVVATSGNEPLTQAIRAAGVAQADAVMAKVWQLQAPKREWRAGKDLVPLLEIAKVFPELGAKAGSLLGQAPVKEVGPGIIPSLYEQAWARPTLDQWLVSADASKPVKNAIDQAKRGAR